MSNQDIIFISGLTIPTNIGVNDWEHSFKQKVVLDIEVFTDIKDAALNDDIDATVDYKLLSDSIYENVTNSKFKLIEALASSIIDLIFKITSAEKVRLKLSKPKAVALANDVGVVIERHRE